MAKTLETTSVLDSRKRLATESVTLSRNTDKAGSEVVIPDGVRAIVVGLQIPLADRLREPDSFTAHLHVERFERDDWRFVTGTTWKPYGAKGLRVTHPDNTTEDNPEPRLCIPAKAGERLRVLLKCSEAKVADVTIDYLESK